jgi:hypothetical protein
MHSSISNSELTLRIPRAVLPAAVILLAIIAAFLAIFEFGTRTVIDRRSKVQKMVNLEYSGAIQIRRPGIPGGSSSKQLLVVGNSLVGHGIDLDELKKGLPAGWQASRFWIYNTAYTDWHFGLRRLFAEGSRPNTVAVVFAAMHWNSTGIRGDYASQYLFEARDLPQVAAEADLDRTETSSLFLARYSKFYALRSDIRKVLLDSVMPDLPQMYNLFKPGLSRRFTDGELIPLFTERMKTYRTIVETYGSKLILIVPPVPRPGEEHQQAIRMAAHAAGVQVVMPMSCSDVPAGDFLDDVHLTPEGAKLYTAQVVKQLPPVL